MAKLFDIDEIARSREDYLRAGEQTVNLDVAVTFCWWARACVAVAIWLLQKAFVHGVTGECAKRRFPLFKSAV